MLPFENSQIDDDMQEISNLVDSKSNNDLSEGGIKQMKTMSWAEYQFKKNSPRLNTEEVETPKPAGRNWAALLNKKKEAADVPKL